MPSSVEDLLVREAGPEAVEDRLAAAGHVPADARPGLDHALDRIGVERRRHDTDERLGGAARVEDVARGHHPDPDPGAEVIVAARR